MRNKLLILLFSACLFGFVAYASAQYIGSLTSDTAPTSDDLVETENNPGGTPTSRKVTLGDVINDINPPTYCFVINAASASDDFLLFQAPVALTITDIKGVLLTGTNVVGGLDECDSNGANPVAVDSDITFNGGLDEDDGSLTNGSIDANDWVKWHTTSSSSPGYLTVCVYYTVN